MNGKDERSDQARKQLLLRLDPAVHAAMAQWASDELRSVNAQIELVLRESLKTAGRAPKSMRPLRKQGRPTKETMISDGQ